MRTKTLSKQIMPVTAFLGLVLFVVLLLSFVSKNSIYSNLALLVEKSATSQKQEQADLSAPLKSASIDSELTTPPKNTDVDPKLPALLKIPSIDVTASFEYVGLTPDGAMDVPKAPNEVAWFNLGPRPGENGSAVIAGHYGWKNNLPAVFDNLHKLRKGNVVFVKNGEGVTETFVVREMKIYGGDEIVPEVFSSSDGKAHLNLITCTGEWNKDKNTYSERLVVFTDKN